MTKSPTPLFLEEVVDLLVSHFGAARVRAALTKALGDDAVKKVSPRRRHTGSSLALARTLEAVREQDDEKYHLLTQFHRQLVDRTILAESQDIRQFAQLIGFKELEGKSRKEMVARLMRFLVALSTARLRANVQVASTISEHQRQLGFSVLTDKLLGRK